MKRLVIAIIIFALTVGGCISGFFTVTARGEQMIDILSHYADEAENNPNAPLDEFTQKINKEWSRCSTLFKSLFIHNDFSEIETLLDKLNGFAKQNSPVLFSECCNEVISRLCYTLNNEKPKIQNIL